MRLQNSKTNEDLIREVIHRSQQQFADEVLSINDTGDFWGNTRGILHISIQNAILEYIELLSSDNTEEIFRDMLSFWMNNIDNDLLNDMSELEKNVERMMDISQKSFHLNPAFGIASVALGGADADHIIDGCIYDIKSTINPTHDITSHLKQLIAYTLLDYENKYSINRLGLIYPRQGLIWNKTLDEFIRMRGSEKNIAELRSEFRMVWDQN